MKHASLTARPVLTALVCGGMVAAIARPGTADEAPKATAPIIAKVGPWSRLPGPFRKKLTAVAALEEGASIFFVDDRSVGHDFMSPDASNTDVTNWPFPVDAALSWSATQLLVFSGDETFLIDTESEEIVDHDLVKLGLPKGWDRIDGAANLDETHWIFFKGKQALVYRFPVGDAPGKVESVIELEQWWKEWTDGIDAATNLPDGRLVVFRGREFKIIDAQNGYFSARLPYAEAGE